ncbi:MAG: sulfurtransferase [Gammaproteobacteria bacterium]|nr:sulfurtransferase [Gammaproteobacteria bacterium]
MKRSSNLVSNVWLNQNLLKDDIVILHVKLKSVNKKTEVTNTFIPNSMVFDVEYFSDQKSRFPHTSPNYEDFCKKIYSYGINVNSHVIIYDEEGVYSSPWVWWLFKLMGHRRVSILDGGLKKWISDDMRLSSIPSESDESSSWLGIYNPRLKASKEEVFNATQQSNSEIILDARSYERHKGIVAEPRTGLKRGHIPKSINIPYYYLIDDDGCYKKKSYIEEIFSRNNINIYAKNSIYFYCGSGITACIVLFAAFELRDTNLKLYDGSWSEWGIGDMPIE